jgi:HK97 family phage prohead protease
MTRDYETASMRGGYEIGGGGYITGIDGRSVLPPVITESRTPEPPPEKRYHLQGYALRWRTAIQLGDNRFAYFMPGSIPSLMAHPPKSFHFDHDESVTITTTRGGLVLLSDDYGIAMRVIVPRTPLGRKAVALCKSNDRQALSIGVTMDDSSDVEIDGSTIEVVTRATLAEVSMVKRGACGPAYCVLIDADNCDSLATDSKSLRVLTDGAAAGVSRALGNLLDVAA